MMEGNKLKINYEKLHALSFLNRENLYKDKFGIDYEKFSTRLGEIEKDPFIGFVGSKYSEAKVRVLFLGKSNAESKPKDQDKDILINQYLKQLRDSPGNFEQRYREYAKQYSDKTTGAFRTWDINRFPVYFRNRTRIDIEETAYANIVPFRYIGAPSKRVYKIAFNNFTNELVSIIQPHQIIPLGANLDTGIIKDYLDTGELSVKISNGISREGRDKRISDEGYRTLDQAIEDYEDLLLEN